jgi:hypothetical protein
MLEKIRYGNQLRECPPLTLITATHLLYIEWMRLKSWLFCVVVWQNLYWLAKRRSTIILRVFCFAANLNDNWVDLSSTTSENDKHSSNLNKHSSNLNKHSSNLKQNSKYFLL